MECSDFPITDYCTLKQHCIFIYFTCIKSFIHAFITVADEADNEDDEDDEDEASQGRKKEEQEYSRSAKRQDKQGQRLLIWV